MLSARVLLLFFVSFLLAAAGDAAAQTPPSQKAAPQTRAQNFTNEACPRPAPSSLIPEPADLRSENGVLEVHVAFRNELDANGHTRYCYVFGDGLQSPNLRLRPGDLLILTLKNELTSLAAPIRRCERPERSRRE